MTGRKPELPATRPPANDASAGKFPLRGGRGISLNKTGQTSCGQGSWPNRDTAPIALSATRGNRKSFRFSLLLLLGCCSWNQPRFGLSPTDARRAALGGSFAAHRRPASPLAFAERHKDQGQSAFVRDNGLLVNIKKTNNKKAYAKGQSLIPRADVSLIDLKGRRGAKFRWIMTSVGAALGTTLTVVCRQYTLPDDLCLFVFAPLGRTVGYLVGRALDANVRHIKLVDDPPQGESPPTRRPGNRQAKQQAMPEAIPWRDRSRYFYLAICLFTQWSPYFLVATMKGSASMTRTDPCGQDGSPPSRMGRSRLRQRTREPGRPFGSLSSFSLGVF